MTKIGVVTCLVLLVCCIARDEKPMAEAPKQTVVFGYSERPLVCIPGEYSFVVDRESEATNNIVIGINSSAGNYSGCVLIGHDITARADNHVVIKSGKSTVIDCIDPELAEEMCEIVTETLKMEKKP